MTKAEIVKAVAQEAGLSGADARKAVDALIDTVGASLRKGDVIAEAVGVAPSTVRDWLAQRTSPTGVRAERVAVLVEMIDRLMRVMDHDYIPVWLDRPIQALDDRRPLELLASGRTGRSLG
jgi:uncharacterized protein (DUF2384 family)